ncbi:hypothetical protein Goari_017892 [Gossypium aridum]|uniref:DUF4283 domain-containing protein n=1 Tax=Gossypium aridum TaxID=34290 RepID=A0A7J8WMZ0_GOSAI|nr:hypothetical protein [Gossypium aridum]
MIDRNMENVVVIRLLGRNIGYRVLDYRVHSLWNLMGSCQLNGLDNDFYLVKISNKRDYEKVLIWQIYGHYVTV